MAKCPACEKSLCEQSYDRRNMCQNPKECTCTCQESEEATTWKFIGSVAVGALSIGGAVALTVVTGGIGGIPLACGVVGGGALTGAGASSIINPIARKISGERMTLSDYATDVSVGAVAGLITGPIGAAGGGVTNSIAANVAKESCKRGAVKLACRAGFGAVSGAVRSTIDEVRAVSADERSFDLTNVAVGSLVGMATGGAGHITGNASRLVSSSGVSRAVGNVIADTASVASLNISN